MAEEQQVCRNQLYPQPLQPGDTDFDGRDGSKKPIERAPETSKSSNRPSPDFDGYDSSSSTQSRSPKRKPKSDLPLQQKKARYESEEAVSPLDRSSKGPLSAIPSPALTRSSTHKQLPAFRGRPRAASLPPRLSSIRHGTSQQAPTSCLSEHTPPVNLKTLRELELQEFYRNPKLRHDVVYDSQLHFRPNNDGNRGAKKKVDSSNYWSLVLWECDVVLKRTVPNAPLKKLPILLATMRDILLTLVPRADREEVEASLDPQLLMQQLEHGILDLKRMSQWLARIFKAHCAPMRDQWVDLMVQQFTRGVDHMDTRSIVEGWKSVFGILEAMKLDVANHQIRTLRPHLVSTAVVFEQSYFQSRIDQGRLEIREPLRWFRDFLEQYKQTTQKEDHVDCFMKATLDMITPSKKSRFQSTFVFDYERLECLRDDIREATCLKLCILLYRQIALMHRREIDDREIASLKDCIAAILGDESGPEKWALRGADVALHIAKTASGLRYPPATLVTMAENWLTGHIQMDSNIYLATEKIILKEIMESVDETIKGWSQLSAFPISQIADSTGTCITTKSIGQRLANITYLHWQVFGRLVYLRDEYVYSA